jgi:hypothetical protein
MCVRNRVCICMHVFLHVRVHVFFWFELCVCKCVCACVHAHVRVVRKIILACARPRSGVFLHEMTACLCSAMQVCSRMCVCTRQVCVGLCALIFWRVHLRVRTCALTRVRMRVLCLFCMHARLCRLCTNAHVCVHSLGYVRVCTCLHWCVCWRLSFLCTRACVHACRVCSSMHMFVKSRMCTSLRPCVLCNCACVRARLLCCCAILHSIYSARVMMFVLWF